MTAIPVLGTPDEDSAIFCTRTNRIIDTVSRSGNPLEHRDRLALQYGDALIVLPFEEAWDRFETSFKSQPAEIPAARFDEALCVLPPVAWKTDHDGESFKISERIAGTVTSIYVRIGDRYVTFSDDIRTPHSECCRRAAVYLSLPSLPPPA